MPITQDSGLVSVRVLHNLISSQTCSNPGQYVWGHYYDNRTHKHTHTPIYTNTQVDVELVYNHCWRHPAK